MPNTKASKSSGLDDMTPSPPSTHSERMAPFVPTGDTLTVQRRYDRIAPVYDAFEMMMEVVAGRFRRRQWARVEPGRVLELGAGTGKNLALYPPDRDIVATDISTKMLERARVKAKHLDARVHLEQADAQHLPYPDQSFEVVVATFLFCSVPDPVQALTEARRVLVPGGQLLLLEHVLSRNPLLRWLMRLIDPIPALLWGAHIARETVQNVHRAGFTEITDTNLSLDIVKLIEARAPDHEAKAPAMKRTDDELPQV